MGLVELIMATTFEVKCACGNKDVNEAGLQDALKTCSTCGKRPQSRVKLSYEATVSWTNK
jgi:hypothetical protein